MASMSRLAFNTATRLCLNKSGATTSSYITSILGIPSSKISKIVLTSSNNRHKKSITAIKSAGAVTLGIHLNAAQLCGNSTSEKTLAATPMLLRSKYKPLEQKRHFSSLNVPLQAPYPRLLHQNVMAPLKNCRYISSKEITKNMTLYTNHVFKNKVDKNTLEFKNATDSPLVLMMAWLMAKQKHVKKYAEIYTELGFDVMVVHITPWQFLWPKKGAQVVSAEILKFLENNKAYSPIIVHGFSVGAYLFGEIMLQMSKEMERYSHILNRIMCQIWDSAADVTGIADGLSKSIFPKNQRMQTALRNYTLYHLKTFHNQATIHYMRSSQMFSSTLCKKPALVYVSENDPIGTPSANNAIIENWEKAGIKVTLKCWKHSQHVSHFLKHRDEYLDLLFKHLEDTGVFEAVGIKQRAKM